MYFCVLFVFCLLYYVLLAGVWNKFEFYLLHILCVWIYVVLIWTCCTGYNVFEIDIALNRKPHVSDVAIALILVNSWDVLLFMTTWLPFCFVYVYYYGYALARMIRCCWWYNNCNAQYTMYICVVWKYSWNVKYVLCSFRCAFIRSFDLLLWI